MTHARHSIRASTTLSALAEADPALAALSLWCRHRDGPGPAACTTGQTITYGPAFNDLARGEQIGLAAHHILHVALCHSARKGAMAARLGATFDPYLFNLAADALVNEVVLQAGHILPRPRVELSGLLAAAKGTKGQATLAEWDVERLYFKLADDDATRNARRYGEDQEFSDDLQSEDGSSDDEYDSGADWRARVERAMSEGRAAGRGIGRIAGELGDLPKTDTPWERVLRSLVTRVLIQRNPSPRLKPARRWLAAEADARARSLTTPGFEPQTSRLSGAPRIAVLVDASASISPMLRARFGGEIAGIAARTGAEVRLIVFDTTIHVDEVLPRHDTSRRLRGLALPDGGGTDLAPALEAAHTPAPSVIVVLTDLQASIPEPPKGAPVIWALTDPPASAPVFGQIVVLDR